MIVKLIPIMFLVFKICTTIDEQTWQSPHTKLWMLHCIIENGLLEVGVGGGGRVIDLGKKTN